MKKVSLFLVFMLVMGVAFGAAQPVEGKKFEAGGSLDYYSLGQGGNTESNYLYIPLRFGWYIWKGLEIEPEFAVSIPFKNTDAVDVTCLGTVNVFYNYKVGRKFVPFAGGGFSLGNGVPFANAGSSQILSGDAAVNSTAMNLGGGLKYLLSDSVALRAEYRYSRFRVSQDGVVGHENLDIHKVLVGLSFIF